MKNGRLPREALADLDAPRPARRAPYRSPEELPVHYTGWTSPAPCGLPVDAWAARTNMPEYVTCVRCRARTGGHELAVAGAPGPARTWPNEWPAGWPEQPMLVPSLTALVAVLDDDATS